MENGLWEWGVCVCVWLIAIRATIRIHWRQTVSYWSSGIMLSITIPPSFPSPLPSCHHSHAITVLIRPSPAGTSFSFLPSSSPLHWSPSWLFSSLLFFFVFCLFLFSFSGRWVVWIKRQNWCTSRLELTVDVSLFLFLCFPILPLRFFSVFLLLFQFLSYSLPCSLTLSFLVSPQPPMLFFVCVAVKNEQMNCGQQ